MQKITISVEASEKKHNLRAPENMGFLAPKRNGNSDYSNTSTIKSGYLPDREKHSLLKIVVNLGIKVELKSIPVSLQSFPFQLEQPTKDKKWIDIKNVTNFVIFPNTQTILYPIKSTNLT